MKKIRFIVIGSGWRAMFYARIAKAMPERFELCAMYCRTKEKADKIAAEMNIHTTCSEEECVSTKPDFAVIAVFKNDILKVAKQWLDRGIPVLCETPLGYSLDEVKEAWRLHKEGAVIQTAEQYHLYPSYSSMIKLIGSNILGEAYNITLSAVHDYHAVSIIRKILGKSGEPLKIYGKEYFYPVVETMSRYEKFFDGRTALKGRVRLTLEYGDGKCGFYDFCSVQYRSTIRERYLNIQGVKGECNNITYSYLDEKFMPRKESLKIEGDDKGISRISFRDNILYENDFRVILPEDETAIAKIMTGMMNYIEMGREIYSVRDALTDSYITLKMHEALKTGESVYAFPEEIFTS